MGGARRQVQRGWDGIPFLFSTDSGILSNCRASPERSHLIAERSDQKPDRAGQIRHTFKIALAA
jgi:hypothetical protein